MFVFRQRLQTPLDMNVDIIARMDELGDRCAQKKAVPGKDGFEWGW